MLFFFFFYTSLSGWLEGQQTGRCGCDTSAQTAEQLEGSAPPSLISSPASLNLFLCYPPSPSSFGPHLLLSVPFYLVTAVCAMLTMGTTCSQNAPGCLPCASLRFVFFVFSFHSLCFSFSPLFPCPLSLKSPTPLRTQTRMCSIRQRGDVFLLRTAVEQDERQEPKL